MAKKSKPATTNATSLPAVLIGTRIRCTDDGMEGRIVRANGLMVTVAWNDGEKITWRRDSLASKPIQIIDDEAAPATEPTPEQPTAETQAESSAVPTPTEQPTTAVASELPEEEQPDILGFDQHGAPYQAPAIPEKTATEPQAPATEKTTEPVAPTTEQPITWNVLDASPESQTYLKVIGTVTAVTLGDAQDAAKTLFTSPHIVQAPEAPAPQPGTAEATAVDQSLTPAATAQKRTRKAKKSESAASGEKKLSALDAAARVLAEEGRPMSCQELIASMAAKGLWSSPGGQTPAATLYSAILRELSTKGDQARFVKTERGKFGRKA